jgi:hypothetical protein
MTSSRLFFRGLSNACVLGVGTALIVSGCGGGADAPGAVTAAAPAVVASSVTSLEVGVPGSAALPAEAVALPAFHALPVLPAPPDGGDAWDIAHSAHQLPTQTLLSQRQAMRSTARLSLRDVTEEGGGYSSAPMASSSAAATYTPAQIRAAYQMPSLPASMTGLSAAQAAQMGAGQTVYIVDAQHDPNAAAELASFNASFGLPGCASLVITPSTKLPLAAAANTGCQFSVVYSSATGAVTNTAPAYDSGWATEIALDVQWVHATAPLARVILIEAPDAGVSSLTAAVSLANTMGPGVVSMSFGAPEGAWTASVDTSFQAANMSYLAATGDNGSAVNWPAVSPHVLAVGGTTLTYGGTGPRSESAWSGSGGGVSQFTAAPVYQTNAVPGMGTPTQRNVSDVSFNADPYSGQYVAVIAPGSTTTSWMSVGGTSLATPQWAALLAIANAQRALAALGPLGDPHAALYTQISAVPGTYSADLADVTKGADGVCATCAAKVGYDTPTGLGTPNVSPLLTSLVGAGVSKTPIVSSAAVNGVAKTALSYTVAVTSPDSVTFSLVNAPSGMSISASGVLAWASPVAGTYTVTVVAKDTKTALSGQGVLTITIAPPPTPTVAAGSVSGMAGVSLSFSPSVTSVDPVTWTLSGAPAGMSMTSAGVVTWANPVTGTFKVTVTATDTKDGQSGQGVYSVTIAAKAPPTVNAASAQGVVGTAFSFAVSVQAQNPLTFTLAGAPSGMTISASGVLSWTNPVAGTYSVTVTAKDSKTGLTGSGVVSIKIAASAITITSSGMTASASKGLAGTIAIGDPGATSLSVQISGVPLGMSFSVSGFNLNASWPKPVVGNYSLSVAVTDGAGHSATVQIPVTITK